MPMMLRVENLSSGYADTVILDGVSLSISKGEVVALLGRNGAGKTTLLRTISGLLPAKSGRVRLGDTDITRWSPERRVRAGIAHVPQGRRIVVGLSVRDNLMAGAYVLGSRRQREERLRQVLDLFPLLRPWMSRDGQSLSGGQQQLLAIARALMSPAALLLLDEPLTGLSPAASSEVLSRINDLKRTGRSILLVEQAVALALQVSDRFYVMDRGQAGPSRHATDAGDLADIQRAYLGTT